MKFNKIIKIFILSAAVLGIAFLSSCRKDEMKMTEQQKIFTEMTAPGIIIGGNYTVQYNKDSFQTSSTSNGTYRIFSDDLTRFVEAATNSTSLKTGNSVSTKIRWYKDGTSGEKELNMIVSKLQDGYIWLWNEDEATGVIVRNTL